jgi:hypothetical protein
MTGEDRVPQGDGPSPGYLYTLGFAVLGFPCIAAGMSGALIARNADDPINALGNYTFATFIFMFLLLFAMRLIFWPLAPAPLRSSVRLLLSGLIALSIPLAVVALWLAFSGTQTVHHYFIPVYFSIIALLCQIGSVLWLIRYRHEGL